MILKTENASLAPESAFARWSLRLRASDTGAFTEVFQATHAPLLRYAWRFMGSEDAAQDVVQDVFLKLWQVRETLDAERSLKALLYRMVRNVALNYNRAAQHYESSAPEADQWNDEDEPASDQRVEAALLAERLQAWVAEMPERRREAFMLSRFHGFSHEEIAQIMDLTPRTVNTHIVLALKHLRERLGALETEHTV